jgi:hypothetical protein
MRGTVLVNARCQWRRPLQEDQKDAGQTKISPRSGGFAVEGAQARSQLGNSPERELAP